MNKQLLQSVMERVENWPEAEQEELLAYALEIEARHGTTYTASQEEQAGIDRGIKDAEAARFASDEQVEAVLATFHHK